MFQNDDFVEVYAKTTGEKQMVPRAWLDDEVLGKDFEVVPSARAVDPTGKPPTIDEVLAEVGDDQALAAAALEAEQAREKPRSTLVEKLQAVIDTPPDSSDPGETPPADGQ